MNQENKTGISVISPNNFLALNHLLAAKPSLKDPPIIISQDTKKCFEQKQSYYKNRSKNNSINFLCFNLSEKESTHWN